MLTPFEVGMYVLASLLLPLAVWSLLTGSKPPQNTILSKYYNAEPNLNFVGNLFLITVCANAMLRLATHLSLISTGTQELLGMVIGIPFGVLLVAFIALWAKAAIKLRRQARTSA